MFGEPGNGNAAIPEMARIIITINAAGQVNVEAPFDQRMLCYGLLEMAREVVYEQYKASQNRIVQPAPGPLPPGPIPFGRK